MKTERGNSACNAGGQLPEPAAKVVRKQFRPLQLELPTYSQSSLGQVSRLPLEVSKQSPSDHFRRTFWRILGWEVILSDFMGLFYSRCHITKCDSLCFKSDTAGWVYLQRSSYTSWHCHHLCYWPESCNGMVRVRLVFHACPKHKFGLHSRGRFSCYPLGPMYFHGTYGEVLVFTCGCLSGPGQLFRCSYF